MNNGSLFLCVRHDCNAKESFTAYLLKVQSFQCNNLHKSNEVSRNRVDVRHKESNNEGRYVLTKEELTVFD